VSEESVDREAVSDFGILNAGEIGPFRPRWKLRMLKTRLAIAFGGGQLYVVGRVGVHNGNSGLTVCLTPGDNPSSFRFSRRLDNPRWHAGMLGDALSEGTNEGCHRCTHDPRTEH
jgi:hypothetical protein